MGTAFCISIKLIIPAQVSDNHYDYEGLVTANNDPLNSGSQPNADQPVEQSSEPDRLLILVKDSNSVRGTASFLERRGVETVVANTMQDVIDRLAQGWSKYVLLSINYPHPKIDLIPMLMSQSFRAEIMVFAETADRKTNMRLTGSKAKHVIFGSPSGPVVLMRLKQMQREAMESTSEGAETGTRHSGARENEADQQVHVSGGSGAAGGAVHFKGTAQAGGAYQSGQLDRSEALSKLMSALKSTETDDASLEREISEVNESLISLQSAEVQKKAKSRLEQMRNSAQKPNVHFQKGMGRGRLGLYIPPPTKKQKETVLAAIRAGQLNMPDAEEHTAEGVLAGPSESAPSAPAETSSQSEHPTLIEQCIREALTRVCGKPRTGRETLLEYQTASVLILSSQQFTGSVLIVIGRGSFDHKRTLRQVESELLKLMSERGIDFSIGEMHSYPIEPAPACEEAFFEAEFCAVSRSEELEVGMAYVDIIPSEPMATEAKDDMLEVSCEDIEPELPLHFELYLYLPMNKKYLRYVKNGSSLSIKQSENLKTNEVKALYLNKGSIEAFKQHATVGNLKKKISKRAA